MQKYRGKVKWFNDEKGFGFLVRDGKPEDLEESKGVFVHYNAIEGMEGIKRKTLVKDQIVDFFAVKAEKGLKAVNVTFVKDEEDEDQGSQDRGSTVQADA